jgi:hypothetical protein
MSTSPGVGLLTTIWSAIGQRRSGFERVPGAAAVIDLYEARVFEVK